MSMETLVQIFFAGAGCYLAYKVWAALTYKAEPKRPSALEIIKTREELKKLLDMNEGQLREYREKKEAYDAKYNRKSDTGNNNR